MPGVPTRRYSDAVGLAVAAAVGYVCALIVASLAYGFVEAKQRALAMDRYGDAMAQSLAQLAVEPLKRRDRVAFGLLVKQMSERDEVWRVAVHTADHRPFIVAGRSAGPGASPYIHSVTAQDTVLGDVRVTLDRNRFGLPLPRLLARSWLFWLGGLLLTGAGFYFGVQLLTKRSAKISKSAPGARETSTKYVLVANLFRRTGMTAAKRDSILRRASTVAREIAEIYSADVAELHDTGIAMVLAGDAEHDLAPVHAALLAHRLFENRSLKVFDSPGDVDAQEESERRDHGASGRPPSGDEDGAATKSGDLFRYGFDLVTVEGEPSPAETARDVALLSSLAPNGEVIVGEAAYAALEGREDLRLDPFESPAARALPPSVSAPTAIVRGIDGGVEALLRQQAERIDATIDDANP